MFPGNKLAPLPIHRHMQVSVRIALGLMAGIAGAELSPYPMSPIGWAAAALVVVVLIPPSIRRTALIAALIGASALSFSKGQQELAVDHHSATLDQREQTLLEGRVAGIPKVWPGRQQVLLQTANARIWLTIYGDSTSSVARLEPGQQIRVLARLKSPIGLRGLGTVDRRRQIMARGADLIASASASDLTVLGQRASLWSWPSSVHFWALDQISESDASDSSLDGRAIVAALTTGDRSRMREPLSKAVRATGIAHLLAVSGMHLAAVVALVFFLVLRTWAYSPWHQRIEARAASASLALLSAIAFAAMTGGRPSTCRALLVAALVLVGMIIDRRVPLLHALAWAASLLLLWRPVLLWDPGFQLSFTATTALALAFGRDADGLDLAKTAPPRRMCRAIWSLFRASFWATLASYPIILYHFGEVSWVGLATNLVAVPFTTILLLPAALAGLVLAAIWPGGGALLIDVSIFLAQLLADACYWVESLVPLAVRAPLDAWELAAWALALLALLLPWPRLTRRIRILVFILFAALLVLLRSQGGSQEESALRVTFVEIGQGDAAVIETPGGEVWLVDGGGLPFVGSARGRDRQRIAESPARQALLPYLRHRGIDHIDLVVISHPHPDHYIGIQAVSRRMPIAELWSVHLPSASPGPYEKWLGDLANAGTWVHRPPLGQARSVHGASLHVLWPRYRSPDARGSAHANADPILTVNDNSLVVRLDFAGRRILFTGDIELEAEELLTESHAAEIRADVVKVPHHGSPTSSTARFVAATGPSLAIISCGRANHFGFPDTDVEARWTDVAAYLLRTDVVGSITLRILPSGQMQVSTVSEF